MLSFNLYLIFTVSFFLHLTSRIPSLGMVRFDFLLVGILLVLFCLNISETWNRYRDSEIARKLVIFICYFLITIPLVKWPGSVVRFGTESYLKVVVFYFFTLAFVTTEKRLKIFIFVFLICQIFRGLEPAWLHYTTGYWGDVAFSGGAKFRLDRLSGAPHDIVNSNQLAWVIVNIAPFIFFLGWYRRGYLLKIFSLMISAILLYALMLTGSRSGLIIMFAVFVGIVFFSENRKRNFLILCIVVIPVTIVISGLLSPDMAERYRSIFDSTAVGADTSHGRLTGVINGFSSVLNIYGLFGHGLGTNREVNVHFSGHLATHNLYLQILQEVGVVGLFLFLSYIASMYKKLISSRNLIKTDKNSFLIRIVQSLLVWMFMDLIYSFSCFGLSSWEWYLFGGVSTVVVILAERNTFSKTAC